MCTDSLLSPSFYEHGEVLSAIPDGDYRETAVTLQREDEIPRYICEREVIIEFLDGMTALTIYTENAPVVYYVTRIIRLRPNVLFSVMPFSGVSTIRLITEKDSEIKRQDSVKAETLEHRHSFIGFGKVCTFFHQEHKNNFYFSGEKHEPYELVYLEQGCLHTIVDGQDVVLHPEECMIIGKNRWHMQYSDVPVRFMSISFTMTSPMIEFLINQSIKVDSDMVLLLEHLVRGQQELLLEEMVESALRLLLVSLLRKPDDRKETAKYPATVNAENEILNRVLQQIAENITSPISLKSLADDAHISVPYLYALFDRHIGVPPAAYITKIRIEESKLLLQNGQLTVGQVCNKMEFSSLQHFSKQFKHIVGISPSQYMKRFRQTAANR